MITLLVVRFMLSRVGKLAAVVFRNPGTVVRVGRFVFGLVKR